MEHRPREAIDPRLGSIKLPAPTADLGVTPRILRAELAVTYFVETHYEDQIVQLIDDDPRRFALLQELAPHLPQLFGRDARPMLAQHWSLFEPIEAELHLYVYTRLDEPRAVQALETLRQRYAAEVDAAHIYLHVIRLHAA